MSLHRIFMITLIVLVVGGAGLGILQMWTGFMPWDVFVKAEITLGVLVILLAFLLVMKADLGEHKKLKDENYLD